MADTSSIEWTDATWNVLTGCSLASPGCTNCYAMKLAGTRLRNHPSREGLTVQTKAGPVWTGEVRFNREWLDQPLRWKRPRTIFVCAHADLFHESVPTDTLDQIFAVMALAGQHTFQVLTKRSAVMQAYFADCGWRSRVMHHVVDLQPSPLWNGSAFQAEHELRTNGFLPNVWLGVSVEDQLRARQRIPDLLSTPAAHRFISAEPLLGPVDLRSIGTMRWRGAECLDALTGTLSGMFGDYCPTRLPALDWVIAGGESGSGARPMDPAWARTLRDQCLATETMFMFKQWGAWAPLDALRLDGARWATDAPVSGRRGNVPDWLNRYVTFERDAGAIRVRGHSFTDHVTDLVYRVGKGRAGRLLDGLEHNDYPRKEATT